MTKSFEVYWRAVGYQQYFVLGERPMFPNQEWIDREQWLQKMVHNAWKHGRKVGRES